MNPFPKSPHPPSDQQQQLLQLLQQQPQLMQKYQQQLTRMQANTKSLHPPMTSQQYLQKLPNIQKYLDSQGGITIQPKSAFVLKYQQKRTNQKIFINIVTHDIIDHPQQKLLVDFQNQPGLRIPMSMGKIKQDFDKNGHACKVIDVVLNPKIVSTAQKSPQILSFTSQIIGNYLLEKYKIAVTEDTIKKVKGLKYKGPKVQFQRVKGKKAPKIQQLSSQQTKIKELQHKKQQQYLQQLNTQQKKPMMRPSFQVYASINGQLQPFSLDLKNYHYLQIVIDLPHLIHSKGIHFQGSTRFIYLFVKNIYELCLKIPFDVGKICAKFSRKERKLEVLVYKAMETQNIKQQHQVSQQINRKLNQNATKMEINNDLLYDLV